MAIINHYVKEVEKFYDTPSEVNSTIEIKSIRDTVIMKPASGSQRYFLYEKKATDSDKLQNNEITVTTPTGTTVTVAEGLDSGASYELKELGVYAIRYKCTVAMYSDVTLEYYPQNFTFYFNIVSVPNFEPLPKWNIRTVIERALNLAEPHLQSVSPRYKLDPTQATEFEGIEAPEFAFTKCTLKEILDQIGGFIHGIPRLIRGESGELDTIHYDMLGGTEEALISSQNIRYITEIHSHNIENYVTELDSSVDNLVNTLDNDEGALTEPYANGIKSVRSEEMYARIEESNMVISTTLPIYSVQKLEVVDPNGKLGDITAYVFEGSEYGRLSSFDGNYPTSKAYALYYNLGENNVKGLAYKSPNVIGGAVVKYSIANIIKAVTGYDNWGDWWGTNETGKYPTLKFRITYTPIFSARILAHKAYIEPGALKRSLVYNQGANLVETRYYGENMKGAIARMGNPEFTRTYRMPDLTYVPKIGQIFKRDGDEYFISSVTVAVYPESVDFTVGMSKDFNRLSQYIGINSEWRAYEVSERVAYNRDIVYSDYAVIGEGVTSDGQQLLNGTGKSALRRIFDGSVSGSGQPSVTCAKVEMFDASGNVLSTVTLPVVSTAFGNAMVFSFGMADNYSAGPKSVPQDPTSAVTGYWQTDVTYSDYYGRADTVTFSLCTVGDTSQEGAFSLPQGNYTSNQPVITVPSDNALTIDKDSRERLRFNYELQFVTNDPSIIIGAALAQKSPLVGGMRAAKTTGYKPCVLCTLTQAVGKFDTKINLASATVLGNISTQVNNISQPIVFNTFTTQAAAAAWAIVDADTGEILIARNGPIAAGATIQPPPITFTHKLP